MMNLPGSPDDDGFDVLGYYTVVDAEKLLEALEKAQLEYRAAVVDGLGTITPYAASAGGSFGQASQIVVSTPAAIRDAVRRVHESIFGDCLPNYDSAFFQEQRDRLKH